MSEVESMIVEGFDNGTRHARKGDVCRELVRYLKGFDHLEADAVTQWDTGLSAEKRQELVDQFWARTKAGDKDKSSRAWLFFSMVQKEEELDGYSASLLVLYAEAAGLEESEIARAFGIVN